MERMVKLEIYKAKSRAFVSTFTMHVFREMWGRLFQKHLMAFTKNTQNIIEHM